MDNGSSIHLCPETEVVNQTSVRLEKKHYGVKQSAGKLEKSLETRLMDSIFSSKWSPVLPNMPELGDTRLPPNPYAETLPRPEKH